MSAHTRAQLFELASGYELGALSPEETAAVEAALPDNAELAAQVLSIRETMGVMLLAEAPIVPRAGLRAEWTQRAASLQRAREEDRHSATATIARITDVRRRPRSVTWLLAAPLAASLTGLGAQLQKSRDLLTVAMAATEKRERQLNTVLEAEDGLLLAILKGNVASETGVQFFWNVRQQRGIVHAFHLPPAPVGRAYQVWVHGGTTVTSVRVFDSGDDGHALIEQIALPDSPSGITSVSITVEPSGGSPQPTTAPILTGELQRRAL